MKLEITKACADSLRTFTKKNHGIQLKSSHAHEIVAAYLGYSSRAALLADKKCPISNLNDAEIIILNVPSLFVEERLKTLENLPSGLPTSDILAAGVYTPIVAEEQFSGKIWTDFHEMAMAYADERAYANIRMMGIDPKELDFVTDIVVKTTETDLMMTVVFDYPAKAMKPLRHASVQITLPRIAGVIGYLKPKVMPTFYHGHMSDPDFRLKHGIA
ncbi:hypothetical protein ACR782_01960 [Sphingobacterium spiritivorum]|uniref:hypothetical protein n=1 Tax=Sphingobacterium spiritivorum TaxID=258 RepID=UPI003DA5E937